MTSNVCWFKFYMVLAFTITTDGHLLGEFIQVQFSPLMAIVPALFSTVLSQRASINRQQGYQSNFMRDNTTSTYIGQPEYNNVQREQFDPYLQKNKQNIQPLRNIETGRRQNVNNIYTNDPLGVIGINQSNRQANEEQTTVEIEKHNVDYQGYRNDPYNPYKPQQLYPQQPYRQPAVNYANPNLNQNPANRVGDIVYPQQRPVIPNGADATTYLKTRQPDSTVSFPETTQSSPESAPAAMQITRFGMNLLTMVNSPFDNVVISPLSISLVLALIQQGTRGEAQEQINKALGMSPQQSFMAFNHFNNVLRDRVSPNLMKLASNLFVDSMFELEPAFKTAAVRNFGSQASLLSFRNPTNAAETINHWVAQKTNERIRELITPDHISPDTKLVIANAIFFKGLWKTKFNPESTGFRPFTTAKNVKIMTPFMRVRRSFRSGYDEVNHLKFVVLPFEGEKYSFIMILPTDSYKLDDVIHTLKGNRLSSYTRAKERELDIEVPKFTVKESLDLNLVLGRLGISHIFTPKLANLEGIGNYQGVSPEISSAVHSAMLSIDENGGTAAAATAFAAVALSYDEYEQFIVDRPFLGVLWDSELNIPLFIVKISDPSHSPI